MDLNIDFKFPYKALKTEDYIPVQVLALRDYYKDYLLSTIQSVI